MATPEVHAPVLGTTGEPCASCAAPLAADQRYCLNCGARRIGVPSPLDELLETAAAAPPAEPPTAVAAPAAGDGRSLPLTWMTAAGGAGVLVVAVLLGALVGSLTGQTPEINVPEAKAPIVNVTGGGAAPAAATESAVTEFVSDWSGEGWTIQIQTLPKEGTDPTAVAAAKTDATGRGAADVGALDSDEYASLDPGNYVVYSGTYASKKDADAALKDLREDFPDATVVEVTTSADAEDAEEPSDTGADGAGATDTKDLEELNNASGDEFVDKSKKLKDETAIEGEPPPEDNKAPGGDAGGDAETIG